MKKLAMAVTMTMLAACGGEPVADECELQQTRCNGDVLELCNYDIDNPGSTRAIWTELEDCTENVDSGNTVCGSFDGDAICEAPEQT